MNELNMYTKKVKIYNRVIMILNNIKISKVVLDILYKGIIDLMKFR